MRLKMNRLYITCAIIVFLVASTDNEPTEENASIENTDTTEVAAVIDNDDDGIDGDPILEEEPEENETDEIEDSEEMRQPYENLLERAPEEPTSVGEALRYPTGPFAGRRFNDEREYLALQIKDLLPPIEEELSEEELDLWWRAFRYLFAEQYPDPDQYIKQLSFETFGNPDIADPKYQFKEQVNVLVILDVSGSMANEIDGKPMMEIAKDAIKKFTSDLPEKANVGLRVYGHEGQSTGHSKADRVKKQILSMIFSR